MKIRHRLFSLCAVLTLLIASVAVPPQSAYATDISITAASVSMSSQGLWKTIPCAQAITIGQGVYVGTDGRLYPGKAVALGSSVINNTGGGGIALSSSSAANQPVTYCYQDPSFTVGGTVASGTVIWLSALNFGGLSSTAGDDVTGGTMVRVFMGVGTGSNKINLNPTQGGTVP